MKEREFHQALHQALRHASMCPGQQEQVLTVVNRQRRSRWVRQLLIPAMAAVLCLSAAVAGRLGAVNWNGEPVAVQEGTLLADRPGGSRLQELCNAVDDRLAFYIRGPEGASISYTSSCYPASLEEMAQQVLAAGVLPWPVQLPKGDSLTSGGERRFAVEEGGASQTLILPGMERAIAIMHPGRTEVICCGGWNGV